MDEETGVGAGPAERAPHAGGDGPAPTRRRRMSAGRKREAVVRLLRGEDLELGSRGLGGGAPGRVPRGGGGTAAERGGGRAASLAAGGASLRTPPADARDD